MVPLTTTTGEIAIPGSRYRPKNYLRLSPNIAFAMSLAQDGYHRCVGWSDKAQEVFGWTAWELFRAENPVTLLFGADVATVEGDRVRAFFDDHITRTGEAQRKTMLTKDGKALAVMACGSIGTCEGPSGLALVGTVVLL